MSDRYQLVNDEDATNWTFDWSTYLGDSGVTISARAWSISPSAGVTLGGPTSETVNVSGLRAGHVYSLTERVTLSNGESKEQHLTLRCEA